MGALGGFAGSADFGTYLHEVMERVDFTVADLQDEVASVVKALGTPSFIEGAEETFVQGIVDAIVTPLGGLGGNALSHIARKDRLAELRFELAVLNAFCQMTQPGSPEREAVVAELEARLRAVFALIEDLEVDPIIPVSL